MALIQGQGGLTIGPPPTENKRLAVPPRARVDFDFDNSDPIIDRVLKSKPKDADPAAATELRKLLHSYQAKWGPTPNPHPPDATITAQILAIAPIGELVKLFTDMFLTREAPGERYSWFLTVALQRIHGISPQTTARRRAELRLIHGQRTTPADKPTSPPNRPNRPESQDPEPALDFARNLLASIQTKCL